MATTTISNSDLNDDENLNPFQGIYDDIKYLLQNTIIKFSYLGEANETYDTKSDADAYFDALYKRDTYFTYTDYSMSDCTNAGIKDDVIRSMVVNTPKQVPRAYREGLLNSRRQRIIDEYEEQNNYYRMLNGLPGTGDKTSITLYEFRDEISSYGIDYTLRIWEVQDYYNNIQDGLGDYYMEVLDGLGIISTLQKTYPKKYYLRYLGTNRIDLYAARTAKNFSILNVREPSNVQTIVYDTFLQYYEQARDYVVSTIFISQFRSFIDYYDRFIGMIIMLMAINQVLIRQVELALSREFYSETAILMIYQVYGIPYNLNIDIEIQRDILHNINIVIMKKATNDVLYLIMTLLGYKNFNIYKYFLVKQRLYDSYGLPVTKLKDEFNTSTGEYETGVIDNDHMYDIYFQKVDLMDTDIMNAFNDKSKRVEYEDITQPDPLWYEDTNLIREVHDTVYNFAESKYIGISLPYSLTDIMFENVLLFKMLMKKKDEISTVTLSLPRIIEDTSVPLFDAIILLICLTCKKHHLKGEIITVPTQVIAVLDYLENQDNGTSEIDEDLVESVKSFLVNPKDTSYMVDTFSFNFDRFVANFETTPPVIKYVSSQGRYYIENSNGTYTYYSKDGNVLKTSVSSTAVDALIAEGKLTIQIVEDDEPVIKFYTATGTYFIYDEDKDRYDYYSEDGELISHNYADEDALLGIADDDTAEELDAILESLDDSTVDEIEVDEDNYYKLINGDWYHYYAHDVIYMLLKGYLTKSVELNGAVNLMEEVRPFINLISTAEAKELLSCLSTLSVNSNASSTRKIAAINSMYQNIKHLNTYLNYLMTKTEDRQTYLALRKFYMTTFYSKEMRELFYINNDYHNGWVCYDAETDEYIGEYEKVATAILNPVVTTSGLTKYYTTDGSKYYYKKGRPAKTYFEFLNWYNPKLYSCVFFVDENAEYTKYLSANSLTSSDLSYTAYSAAVCTGQIDIDYDTLKDESEVESVNETTVYNYISHILTRLEEIIDNLGMIHLINDGTSSLEDLLVKLIKFFKSYTVDLVSVENVLIVDTRALNVFKLIDLIEGIIKDIEVDDELNLSYSDIVERVIAHIRLRERLRLDDDQSKVIIEKQIGDSDTLYLIDNIVEYVYKQIEMTENLNISFSDILIYTKNVFKKDKLSLGDKVIITSTDDDSE